MEFTNLSLCSSIFSKAFTSTLSNFEYSLTQFLTLSLTEISTGKRDVDRMYSTVSNLKMENGKYTVSKP